MSGTRRCASNCNKNNQLAEGDNGCNNASKSSRLPNPCAGKSTPRPPYTPPQNVGRQSRPLSPQSYNPGHTSSTRPTAERAQQRRQSPEVSASTKLLVEMMSSLRKGIAEVEQRPQNASCGDTGDESPEETDEYDCASGSGLEEDEYEDEEEEEECGEVEQHVCDSQATDDDGYDGGCDDDAQQQSEPDGVDFDYIQQELLREKRDVEIAEDLAQSRHNQSGLPVKPDERASQEPELTPKLLATWMYLEQRGLPTTAAPSRIVDFLFPTVKPPLSAISAVVTPALGVAVPVTTRNGMSPIPDHVLNAVAMLEASVRGSPDFKFLPPEVHEKIVIAEPDINKMAAITGVPETNLLRRDSLQLQVPPEKNFNLSATGGYYSALPGGDGFKVTKSPSATFLEAYNAVESDGFYPDDQIKVKTNSPHDLHMHDSM